jgi:hypothetical protein
VFSHAQISSGELLLAPCLLCRLFCIVFVQVCSGSVPSRFAGSELPVKDQACHFVPLMFSYLLCAAKARSPQGFCHLPAMAVAVADDM